MDGQASLAVGSIAISSDGKALYVGSGEPNHSGDSYSGAGILKSTDGGKTWTVLGGTVFKGSSIAKVLLSPSNPNWIMASTTYGSCCRGFYTDANQSPFGVYLSTDGGSTWTSTLASSTSSVTFADLVLNATNPNIVYASGFNGTVWRSINGGTSWSVFRHLTSVNCLTGVGCRVAIATTSARPGSLFSAFSNTNGNLYGIYRDDASTNSVVLLGTPPTPPNTSDPCNKQCDYDLLMEADPSNSNVLYFGGVDLFVSTDGGSTWTDLGGYASGGIHPDQHAFAFLPTSSSTVFSGNDGGIWKSTNRGASWTNLNSGLGLTQFESISGTPGTYLLGGTQDNGCVKYSGSTSWPEVIGGDGGWSGVEPTNTNIAYCNYINLNFRESTDGGQTWADATTGINLNDNSEFYAPVAMDPGTPGTLYIGGTHVYKTTNYASTWSDISGSLGSGLISAISVAPSSSSTVYLGDDQGNLKISTNGGSTWSTIATQIDAIAGIAVDPSNSNTIYVAVAYLTTPYRYSLQGGSWQATALSSVSDRVNQIRINSAKTLFVATDHGAHYSTDLGATWASPGTGLPNAAVFDVEITASNQLIAATHGRGVWMVTPTPPTATTLTASYSVFGGGSGYSAPTLTYTSGGVQLTATLTMAPMSYSLDTGSSWSVVGTLIGSSTSERWATNQAATGSATAAQTVSFTYYHQFYDTFAYSVGLGGSPTLTNAVSYTRFGAALTLTPGSGVAAWVDAATSATYTNPIQGATGERWNTATPSFTISASAIENPTYEHQFGPQVSYASVGGAPSGNALLLSFTSNGASSTYKLTTTPTQEWMAATTFTVGDQYVSATERYSQSQNGTLASATPIVFSIYRQFNPRLSYSTPDGGAPSGNSLVFFYSRYGSASTYTLTTSATPLGWADAGTYAVGDHYVSPTERYSQNQNGTLASSSPIVFAVYHQWNPSLSYRAVSGTPSGSALVVSYQKFGAAATFTLTTTSTQVAWADDAAYAVGDRYVSATERYSQGQNGTLSSASPIAFAIYHQYGIAASYSGTVATNGAPSLACSRFGSASSDLLTLAPTVYWADSGCSATLTKPSTDFPSPTERYETNFANFTVGGVATAAPVFYQQWSNLFDFSVIDAEAPPMAPTLSVSYFGSSVGIPLTKNSSAVWADNDVTCSVTNPIGGSAATERWDTPTSCPPAKSGGGSTTFIYYHQYGLTLSYSVAGGGSPAAPALNCARLGVSSTTTLTESAVAYWCDDSQPWSVTNPLGTSTSSVRWDTETTSSGTVSSAATTAFTYYHQYACTCSFSVSGGGSPSAPTLSGTRFGAASSDTLSTTPATVWEDSSASYLATDPLSGSTSTERWYTHGASGTVSAPFSFSPLYYHQYNLSTAFNAANGGAPSGNSVLLRYTDLGSGATYALTTSPAANWADAGTQYFVGPYYVSSTDRYSQDQNGTLTGAAAIVFNIFHQYALVLSYSVSGGGTPTAPTLAATQFGSPYASSLGTAQTEYWLDAGTAWSTTNPLVGSTSLERWNANSGTSGTVSAATASSPTYVHQFPMTVQTSPSNGGSVTPSSGWYNSSALVRIYASPAAGYQFTGWKGSGTGSYTGTDNIASVTLNGPINETANFNPLATTTSSTTSSTTRTSSSSSTSVSSQSYSTSTPTTTTSSQTAPSTTGGGGGIPEFPYQSVALAISTGLLVISYLLIRRRNERVGLAS